MLQEKKKKRLKILAFSAIFLVFVVTGVSVFVLRQNENHGEVNKAGKESINSVNFDPPTKEERDAGNAQKQENVNNQDNPPLPSNNATIIIVDAGQYQDMVEVRAFISNRIDSDGVCTVQFTKEANAITRTQNAQPDASTTQCGSIVVPRSEFPSGGDWEVTVNYASSAAAGSAKGTIHL